jgi:hypothetical protein
MQPGVEGAVDLFAVGQEKRKRTDEPCKVVTRKRIRKAACDPQGNECVAQTKGHGECS